MKIYKEREQSVLIRMCGLSAQISLIVFISLIIGGCVSVNISTGPKRNKHKVPSWVKHIPEDSKYVYAVGISGRTMYPSHAIKYATENARKELASMISTKVVSMIQSEDSSRREDFSMESIAVTDEDLQGSQFSEKWIDAEGLTGVSPGTTYVLIRIERSAYEELLRKYR